MSGETREDNKNSSKKHQARKKIADLHRLNL